MAGFLFKLMKAVFDAAIQALMKQVQVVVDQALQPVQNIVKTVVGGAWKGDGANAFVEELGTLAIPNIGKIIKGVTQHGKNLVQARQIMEQADSDARGKISGALPSAFNFVVG